MIAEGIGAFDVAVAFALRVAGDGLLADHIKQRADGEFDLFPLRGVGDAALTDEVALPGSVFFVHPDDPGGQRDAEVIVLGVGQFDDVSKMELLFAVFLEISAGEFAVSGEADVGFVKKTDLFLLVVGDGFPERDFVDVVTRKCLLFYSRSRHGHGDPFFHALDAGCVVDAVHVPGQAGDLGMGIGHTGSVVDGDPANQIKGVFVEVEDIIALPTDIGGEVFQIDPKFSSFGGADVPHEAGACNHVFGYRGEDHLRGLFKCEDLARPFLAYHDGRFIRQQRSTRKGGIAAVGVKLHRFADAVFEHRFKGDEVVDIVLREKLCRNAAESRNHAGGDDTAGHPLIHQPLCPGSDVGFANVVDEGAIVIVDRNRQIGSGLGDDGISQKCRDKQREEGDRFHE